VCPITRWFCLIEYFVLFELECRFLYTLTGFVVSMARFLKGVIICSLYLQIVKTGKKPTFEKMGDFVS